MKADSNSCAWSAAALSAGILLWTSGQAVAQQSASAQAMLEEVIVTARRREEGLQDLPLSVTAINAEAMQAQGIYTFQDIGEHIPNLTFTQSGSRVTKAIFLRGVGGATNNSLRPVGATIYLDGHYLPNSTGQSFSTLDIERIEVLRGPQGTLFGKNSTGGAINVVTAKPGPEFDANALLRVADYGQRDLRGMVNVPFNDIVAGRFSLAKETTDGFWYNRTLNLDEGGNDVEAFSVSLRITPNDNWQIDLSLRGNYEEGDDLGGQCAVRPTQAHVDALANMHPDVLADPALAAAVAANHPPQIYTGPVFADGVGSFGGAFTYPDGTNANVGGFTELLYAGATVDAWNGCNTDIAMGDFVTSSEKDSATHIDNENINATIEWDSTGEIGGLDNLTAKLILSQHQTDHGFFGDFDFSVIPIVNVGTTPPRNRRETSQFELLFSGDVNERVQFVVGANNFSDEFLSGGGSSNGCLALFEANREELLDPMSTLQVPCAPDGGGQIDFLEDRQVPFPALASSGRDGRTDYDSVAVFGHLTYILNENWTIEGGARWTDEDRLFHQIEFPVGFCTHTQPGDPPLSQQCAPDYVLTHQTAVVESLYNNASASFSEITPMVSLTRSLGTGNRIEDGIVYFRYAEGFLSGSFNDELNVLNNPLLEPLITFGPETVDSYEVGFKGTFANSRLLLATNLFFMDYQDKQENVSIDNSDQRFGAAATVSLIQNAATVEIFGLELELRAQPWDGGFVSLDVGWLDSEYGEYQAFDPDAGGPIDRSNLTFADFSPEWTVNASIEHAFQLGNGATLTPQLGLYHQTEYDFTTGIDRDGPPSLCFQDSYTKLRGRVTYLPGDGNWEASLFGSNINDERYFENCNRRWAGMIAYRWGPPKLWGLEFNYRWSN